MSKSVRVGDRVEVVVPKEFIRCGYPMDYGEVAEEVAKEHLKEVMTLINKVAGGDYGVLEYFEKNPLKSTCGSTARKIVQALAYAKCKNERFGGSTRLIYTKDSPEIAGYKGLVTDIKWVVTGEYYAPSYYESMDGGDYEPGGLTDQKRHKILEVSPDKTYQHFWIEAKNTKKSGCQIWNF